MHIVQGLRQAAVMIAVGALLAAAAAGVWAAASGDAFRSRFGLSMLVVAGLLALGGGTLLSRGAMMETRAFLGDGPGMDEPGEDEALTSIGVFLFVSLPLFAAGAVVYGSG
ncbi:hypothetical protein [Blastococcus sp. TF02A-35]|uniref:hypothetical protein n=1 Tax=Blastococcus sp. TF02A-35 TaxID=2559612 RepID=UPI0010736D75|nr:hypothetical protein [Blastococcus sp. TF02A_35]TFV53691.1 hypothetical protein E4P43_00070 [Blastococcus sp. TF02A_35]